jgi:amino acid transporter
MMFALARESRLPRALAHVSTGKRVPVTALTLEMLVALGLLTAFRLVGTSALHVFFYLATIGVLNLLFMYMATNLAAARHLGRRDRPVQLVMPLLGVAVAGYVLYRNVWPAPPTPFDRLPYIVAAWLLLGILLSLRRPNVGSPVQDAARSGRGGTGPEPSAT